MPSSIQSLPNEVVQQVLLDVPATSLIAFQKTCRRFNQVAESAGWKEACLTEFTYWHPKHRIRERARDKSDNSDWKTLYKEHFKVSTSTARILDSIISSQMGRIEKIQQIIQFGYDAKDCLIKHMNTPDDAEDVLARRYYSGAVLGCLHRLMAIQEWSRLKNLEDVPLERALCAFDMFVLGDGRGDFEQVTERLDEMALEVENGIPGFRQETTRQKALSIARYLQSHQLGGVREGDYYDLRNNFIGVALFDQKVHAMPLISTAIFCCVARRLGVRASPCGFPFHVISIVTPEPGADLDGNAVAPGDGGGGGGGSPAYIDMYGSGAEVPVADLVERLTDIGAGHGDHEGLLAESTVAEMVLRTGRNIFNSVQETHRQAMLQQNRGVAGAGAGAAAGLDPTAGAASVAATVAPHLFRPAPFPDVESAFYGALWASLLLGIPPRGDGPPAAQRWRTYLPHIVEAFETHFPTDVGFIEDFIVPLFNDTREHAQLRESVRVMRTVDSMPKQVKPRAAGGEGADRDKVSYRVGQVFSHRRYGYQAVITGWDVECGADEQWMARMRVHDLKGGRQQSFYHVLVEDKSVRYVAEENIIISNTENPSTLMSLAGRHFKRWDPEARKFVSNIKDEYPDD